MNFRIAQNLSVVNSFHKVMSKTSVILSYCMKEVQQLIDYFREKDLLANTKVGGWK